MSIPNTIKVRLIRYLRHAAWYVLFPLGALSIGYFCFLEYSRHSMRAMNCEKLSSIDFNKSLNERLTQPLLLTSTNEPVSPVYFHLNLLQPILDETLVVIKSDKAAHLVYRAPYQSQFVIQATNLLLSNGGHDNFKLLFFKTTTHELCVCEHEAAFWQPNKHVYLDLLPFRELNEIGLPVAFKVRVE